MDKTSVNWGKSGRNWYQVRHISKKIVGSSCTVHGSVRIISTRCNVTAEFYVTDRKARWNLWTGTFTAGTMKKQIPLMFRLATKLHLISRYQNSQNNGHWCANSALSTHKVPQHDFRRRPSTKNDMSCRCPYQTELTCKADWNRLSQKWRNTHNTLHDQLVDKKSVSTLGTKRTSDYHTLYGTLSCIWRASIKGEQFLQFTVIRDETWVNHTTFETNNISPSEDIQSNTISREHHDNCLERPQRFAACIFPWPRWHCQ
jgi:hypothetical protein